MNKLILSMLAVLSTAVLQGVVSDVQQHENWTNDTQETAQIRNFEDKYAVNGSQYDDEDLTAFPDRRHDNLPGPIN
jgi:hypothetical protein